MKAIEAANKKSAYILQLFSAPGGAQMPPTEDLSHRRSIRPVRSYWPSQALLRWMQHLLVANTASKH